MKTANINVTHESKPAPPSKLVPFDWHQYAVPHDVLLKKEFEPIAFIVEDILVDLGTGALAGIKKIGKTFMALQLSQSVGSGTDFLGHKVRQGKVVHFALEDGDRRTQQRLRMQGTSDNLPITYFYKWLPFNTPEGFKQLQAMLQELKPSLVVVDTFAKCLNGKPDQNSAGDMGDFGNRIHDLALELNLMILFIAHHGKSKMATRDPGFDIRGSSAIPGATDVNIGLYRNDDGSFDLIGEGRDISEFDVRAKLDKEITWAWQYVGEAKDVRRAEAEAKILAAIATLGGEADAGAIAGEIGISREAVQQHLPRMRSGDNATLSFHIVERPKRILYRLLTTLTDTPSLLPLHSTDGCKGGVRDMPSETVQSRGIREVRETTNTPKTDGADELLPLVGKSRAELVSMWQAAGKPWVYLGDGGTEDLDRFLELNPTPSDRAIAALKDWVAKQGRKRV